MNKPSSEEKSYALGRYRIQNIEHGYERKLVTGAVFIDLTAAYDTINHRILFKIIYEITLSTWILSAPRGVTNNNLRPSISTRCYSRAEAEDAPAD